jgi:predicted molibdopterin-dependent oxidoreductase YjgC
VSAPAAAGEVALTIDGRPVTVPAGATLLDACGALGLEVPTLCWARNLTPASVCRLCVVELEGSRTLAPSCSRQAEPGMVVHTDSERVRHSRRLVLELLGSSVDMRLAPRFAELCERYGARPERFGPPAPPADARQRDAALAGHHPELDGACAATVGQPVTTDNALFVRDGARCMLCYRCVQACGADAQHTFAISVAGRGLGARISTEHAAALPDSGCVFCGNCVGVCPTGALMFRTEHELRAAGRWDEARQQVADTICPYCGVGCTLTLRVQDNQIVRVTSPADSGVGSGHLCIKGRFGLAFVGG